MHVASPTAEFAAPDPDRLRAGVRRALYRAGCFILILGLGGVQMATGTGQGVPSPLGALRSQSGQFIVKTAPLPNPPRAILKLTADSSFVHLQPSFLAVSCERIRQALNQELNVKSPWRGKIYLALYPAATSNDTVYLTSERFTDGWQYQVRMPQVLARDRYVSAVTQVLLLELANRGSPDRAAEIPAWLSDGLAQALLFSRELQLVPPPPTEAVNGVPVNSAMVDFQAEHPLQQAHQQLTLKTPLTFQELSWPTPEQLEGEAGEHFRACAQFFVKNLLALPDGPACLRALLAELPRHLNWQFAFLRAFHATFQRPLEVEKWWALHTACLTGRDLSQTWGAEESWRKLDEALRMPVEIRANTNDLPLRGEITLQTILRDWAPQPRDEAIKAKLAELHAVRLRLPPEMTPLLDEYRRVLTRFLQRVSIYERGVFKAAVDQDAINEALKTLEPLDKRRQSTTAREPTAVQSRL